MEAGVEPTEGLNTGKPTSMGVSDTSPDAERVLLEGYRRMSPAEKLERVFSLNRALEQLQRARIAADYGDIPEREMRLRLGALRMGRETMIKVFAGIPTRWGGDSGRSAGSLHIRIYWCPLGGSLASTFHTQPRIGGTAARGLAEAGSRRPEAAQLAVPLE
jgi:hypothetical protein